MYISCLGELAFCGLFSLSQGVELGYDSILVTTLGAKLFYCYPRRTCSEFVTTPNDKSSPFAPC